MPTDVVLGPVPAQEEFGIGWSEISIESDRKHLETFIAVSHGLSN